MLNTLMDDVIKKFGFESEETVMFCNCCELLENEDDAKLIVMSIYKYLMEK
jgi:hypothetical protein